MEGLDPITDRERGLVQIDFIAIFGQNLTKYDFNVYLKNHGETASFNFFLRLKELDNLVKKFNLQLLIPSC